jgi:hypothetical protein
MTEWSKKRQMLEYMRMSAILARAPNGKPDPSSDELVGVIEDEIYLQEQREKVKDSEPECADTNHAGNTPDNVDLDYLHVLKFGNRSTTFRIDGRAVTFGEFRRAAKKKGVEIENRLKLDGRPERFICRGEVRVEQ